MKKFLLTASMMAFTFYSILNAQTGNYGFFFQHTTETGNMVSLSASRIENSNVDSDFNVKFLITHNYTSGVYCNFPSGIFILGGNHWGIANELGTTLPLNAKYNAVIPTANGTMFMHTSDAGNIYGHQTQIDNSACNNTPGALLFIVHTLGSSTTYCTTVQEVAYSTVSDRWLISNADNSSSFISTWYNIFVTSASSTAFIHTATTSNTTGHLTYIDHAALNNNPNAVILITQNNVSSVSNNHYTGVYYDQAASKWSIYNEDMAAMPENARFNVLIAGDLSTSVNEQKSDNRLSFSPNPASDFITVQNPQNNKIRVRIFDISGKLLTETINTGEPVDVRSLEKGIYLVQCGKYFEKLLIER